MLCTDISDFAIYPSSNSTSNHGYSVTLAVASAKTITATKRIAVLSSPTLEHIIRLMLDSVT